MAPRNFLYRDIEEYTNFFSEAIKEGAFARVYRGKIPKDNVYNLPKQKVAVKSLIEWEHRDQFETEVRWLERFQHEGIIEYIGMYRREPDFFIVLRYIKKGDLERHIDALSWNDTLHIIRGIAAAISYVHHYDPPPPGRLVIGDLKPANILLAKGNKPKLCDFGSIKSEGAALVEHTKGYLDPRAYKRRSVQQGDDIYSFGIIILQLIMKQEALKGEEHIRDTAERSIEKDPFLVQSKLLVSGCSKSDACAITKLAMDLTWTKKPKPPPKHLVDYWNTCFGPGNQMKEGGGNEKGEIEELENESGRGNGEGNGSTSSEGPDRPTIQETIEVLDSLKVNQFKRVTSEVLDVLKLNELKRASGKLVKLVKKLRK